AGATERSGPGEVATAGSLGCIGLPRPEAGGEGAGPRRLPTAIFTPRYGIAAAAISLNAGAATSPPYTSVFGSSMTIRMTRRGSSAGTIPTNEAIRLSEYP